MTRSRSPVLQSLVAYLAVFAILMHAWWSTATQAVPPGNDLRDSRLIIWVLGWVTHALVNAPSRLFDAPIFFPAPAQLAGSEHFLSAQLVFAPLYWAGGNAVLAANLTALLTYPLSALAMECLLAAQGVCRGAAWIGGLAFALGVLRVPASLHVLQYPVLFLPLVALRLQRVRECPNARMTVLLGAALLAGVFSSYYLAALLAVTTLIWGTFELVRAGGQRVRLLGLGGAALATSGAALAWFSQSYFYRLSALTTDAAQDDVFWTAAGRTLLAAAVRDPVWVLLAAFAVGGALANVGRTGRRGLVVTAGAFIAAGLLLLVAGWPWPLNHSFGFFRDRTRYLLLASFGFNLLVALGYDSLRGRLSCRWAGTALCLALTGALVGTRMGILGLASDPILAVTRDRDEYARLAELVRQHGPGPILELPYVSTLLVDRVPEQMVGQLRHSMPLVNGYTGYRPPHVPLLESLIRAVPAAPALDDLVDMTHLRWIVVRPEEEWADARGRRRLLAGLARYPALGSSYTVGPWIVQRVDRAPEHRVWFDAVAAGPQAGRSALGTPVRRIPESEAIAPISARVYPGLVLARRFVGIEVSATNRGAAAWPAWAAGGWNESGLVHWQARWRRAEDGATWSAPHTFPLRRDVAPNEMLAQPLMVPTPAEPGAYELEITLAQQDGARFSASGNEAGRIRLEVEPARR